MTETVAPTWSGDLVGVETLSATSDESDSGWASGNAGVGRMADIVGLPFSTVLTVRELRGSLWVCVYVCVCMGGWCLWKSGKEEDS